MRRPALYSSSRTARPEPAPPPGEAAVAAATDPRIRRVGRVPAADRNGLLKMAEAMVFPSQYEGFGAPLIEAMALGCAVIASDSTCIPAVLDGAGLALPLTTAAWADALDRVAGGRAAMSPQDVPAKPSPLAPPAGSGDVYAAA